MLVQFTRSLGDDLDVVNASKKPKPKGRAAQLIAQLKLELEANKQITFELLPATYAEINGGDEWSVIANVEVAMPTLLSAIQSGYDDPKTAMAGSFEILDGSRK